MVDFLLDRVASDVHVLITSQQAGSGGVQYQVIFYGQNKFKNSRDTLHLTTDPNATDFERRDQIAHYLKLGLVPYVLKTDHARAITITMKPSATDSAKAKTVTRDQWNYWVLRLGANGYIDSDQVYQSGRMSGNFSANRTTDKLKINFFLYGGKNFSSYEIEKDSILTNIKVINNDYGFSHSWIKSINDHWSYGYEANFTNNSFSNNKSRIKFQPAIEYNFFKYQDVNTKRLTASYGIQVRHNTYYDTTIFNKTGEVLWAHNLRLSASLNQKWGTFSSGLAYRNYLKDFKLNNFGININSEVRITGGLTFYIFVYGGIVHDQVYLLKEGASAEEVLTRRRQLASSYNFSAFFGLNYRFGSKLNNFINPRFEGAGYEVGSD